MGDNTWGQVLYYTRPHIEKLLETRGNNNECETYEFINLRSENIHNSRNTNCNHKKKSFFGKTFSATLIERSCLVTNNLIIIIIFIFPLSSSTCPFQIVYLRYYIPPDNINFYFLKVCRQEDWTIIMLLLVGHRTFSPVYTKTCLEPAAFWPCWSIILNVFVSLKL